MSREFWNRVWSRPYGRYNRHHLEIWKAMLPLLEGKILDLGCGSCLIYQGTTVSLTGVDWSEEAIAEARKNYPPGTYFVSDIRSTGLPDASFDTVVLLGVLDYFDNWQEVLVEARRLKKPGGKIFATLLNGFSSHDWTKYPHITGNWHLYVE